MKKQFVLIPLAEREMAELPLRLRGELWELVGVLEEKGTLTYPQGRIVDEEKRVFEIRERDTGEQARVLYYYWNGGRLDLRSCCLCQEDERDSTRGDQPGTQEVGAGQEGDVEVRRDEYQYYEEESSKRASRFQRGHEG
jgi:hypothetical protein